MTKINQPDLQDFKDQLDQWLQDGDQLLRAGISMVQKQHMVAHYLRQLSEAVDAGHIVGFKLEWDGEDIIDTQVRVNTPLPAISVKFVLGK